MTLKERSIIDKILASDYADGLPLEELIGREIWTFSVSTGPGDNALIGSLARKGYVGLGNCGRDQTIWIKAAGAAAYQEQS